MKKLVMSERINLNDNEIIKSMRERGKLKKKKGMRKEEKNGKCEDVRRDIERKKGKNKREEKRKNERLGFKRIEKKNILGIILINNEEFVRLRRKDKMIDLEVGV